jgi:hypothetical protein
MKLRIRGNSVRFRLSRSEMARLEESGMVEDSAEFGADSGLSYGLKIGTAEGLEVSYGDDRISVLVPEAMLEVWAEPEEVSLSGEQSLPGGGTLAVLLEKDFACLAPRDGDDDTDTFPNPLANEPEGT